MTKKYLKPNSKKINPIRDFGDSAKRQKERISNRARPISKPLPRRWGLAARLEHRKIKNKK